MKKVLLTLAVIGTLFFSSCEKEELTVPQNSQQTLTLKEQALLCNCGGGSWDITDPEPEGAAAFTTASYDGETDTVATPVKPTRLRKEKK